MSWHCHAVEGVGEGKGEFGGAVLCEGWQGGVDVEALQQGG